MTNISIQLYRGAEPILITSDATKPADLAKDIKAALLPEDMAELSIDEIQAREDAAEMLRKRANVTTAFGRFSKMGIDSRSETIQKIYAVLAQYQKYPVSMLKAIHAYKKAVKISNTKLWQAKDNLSSEIKKWGSLQEVGIPDVEPFVVAYTLLYP